MNDGLKPLDRIAATLEGLHQLAQAAIRELAALNPPAADLQQANIVARDLLEQALSEKEAADARVKTLEEALWPFAEHYDKIPKWMRDSLVEHPRGSVTGPNGERRELLLVNVAAFKQASAALAGKEKALERVREIRQTEAEAAPPAPKTDAPEEHAYCTNLAEWRIIHGNRPDTYTEACSEHLGALMTNAPLHTILSMRLEKPTCCCYCITKNCLECRA